MPKFVPKLFSRWTLLPLALAALAAVAAPQSPNLYSDMQWRPIGPTRAGRARALAGVPSQPNVFYIGYDNGGVFKSTDYGSNWTPLFDAQPTGSVGGIAVSPSDPNIIYVGSGAGIIRPDLSTGDGMYKSTDAGKTWTHLGLRDTQMIANVEVDPKDPNRVFVAALGHPYGPNEERGIFRSTDGGRTFQKVLYADAYTSANEVRIDPKDPNIVYAGLWQQQQGFSENGTFGPTPGSNTGGLFKSTDGGDHWTQLKNGLPEIGEVNLAISPSDPKVVYAAVASAPSAPAPGAAGGRGAGRGGRGGGGGAIQLYKTTDGGDHWFLATNDPRIAETGSQRHPPDTRPLGRIGGGDLPTLAVDGKNPDVVYSCSTVFWRSEDGGVTWSAVRGAPGGDDYQKSWVNPDNSNIILLVSDQGGVVSANRGETWSNWYNQLTAAVYHVTADNAFPYRLCSGQQDSGSACVDSRSNDGEITFHDWHPVNIQEYGMAAPDPKDPDLVYGSQRTGVSLYNRKTGQTASVGPNLGGRGAAPGAAPAAEEVVNRNVRTQPLNWSAADPNALFYATNVVWKTLNGGHTWTRISPDLARATWAIPASAGKYAAGVTPGPEGTVTALAPSPKDVNVLWAGTDDGNIQVTMDGGAKWSNVTPSAIQPWTRIFNMDAGHFDTLTAYAAANSLRIDDLNPHFFRTHDGGKTWTEIDTGLAPGAPANSIREDPKKKGLLYAATDTQVYVSFDDGDHWNSLRLNMPATSVRDVAVKDDPGCSCSDLVVGTHGRGFWILDDVTPLREAAEATAANGPYLFKPEPALRVRFGMNDPTPWPPELAAGQNPPNGAIIDYYLAADASGPVRLEFLNAAGKVIRSYTSADNPTGPQAATDPQTVNKLCQETPNYSSACSLPLYWPAPPEMLGTAAGEHRFTWDMHYQPLGGGGGGRGGGGAGGAVPHRTAGGVSSPWVAPGAYSVRLVVDGKTSTQPITVKMDPRVKLTPAVLQIFTLTTQMENGAMAAEAAAQQARELAAALQAKPASAVNAGYIKELQALAPEPAENPGGGGGRGGRGGRAAGGGAAAAPESLATIGAQMVAAAQGMQASEMPPTAAELAACAQRETEYTALMAKWTALKAKTQPAGAATKSK